MNESGKKEKKYLQLYNTLCSDIASGKLEPGQRLPSIRELVRRSGLSQTTVEHALELMQEEGLIRTVPQSGCFVTGIRPHRSVQPLPEDSRPDSRIVWNLSTGTIHPELFEMTMWKRCLRQTLDQEDVLASYGDSQGELDLRQALADYTYRLRRVRTDPGSILVGSSYQSLLFIFTALVGHPMTVAMEKEAPAMARHVFLAAGWTILELESDEDGPLPEELKKPFDCLYLTTASMGTEKKALRHRQDLYRDLFVIEDDYNGELTYASGPRNALSASIRQSVYIGAFSRVLLPSIRLSCMVLPDRLMQRFDPRLYAPMASRIEQLALARYISSGSLERHVRRLNRLYRRRYELIRRILKDLDPHLDEAYLCVEIRGYTLPPEFACTRTASGIRLSFASLPEASLEEAFLAVRDALEPLDRAGSRLPRLQVDPGNAAGHGVS